MKRIKYLTIILILASITSVFFYNNSEITIDEKREIHKRFLENSPFNKTEKLSKSDRRAIELPPNAYYQKMWELSMNPMTGRPEVEDLFRTRKALVDAEKIAPRFSAVPGENEQMQWVQRGPYNVGGRTKAMMFDPNDNTNQTVFAGGVSGGIFKNTEISNPNNPWELVTENIPQNIAVSSIAYDPNNTKKFYVGTGESYTAGDALGNGLWRSVDGGDTWEKVFGGDTDNPTTYISEGNKIKVIKPEGQNDIQFLSASFGPSIPADGIQSKIVRANPLDGCSTLSNSSEIKDKIVLIERGALSGDPCPFFDKVLNGQNAGALAVIVFNKSNGSDWTDDLVRMGAGEGNPSDINIPSVFIRRSDGTKLYSWIGNQDTEILLSKGTNVASGNTVVPGTYYINDVVVRKDGDISEVYVAAGTSFYRDASNTVFGGDDYGLFRFIDDGADTEMKWERINVEHEGSLVQPIDLEIGPDNKVWLSTTRDTNGQGGGLVFVSNEDVSSFELKYQVEEGRRTEIEITKNNILYILGATGNGSAPVVIQKAASGAIDPLNLTLPNDKDGNINANDFTRGQSFYDLMIEANPINPNQLYVGGIDIFKTTTGGESPQGTTTNPWDQISHWYGGFQEPYSHADQHGAVFLESDPNIVLFGNDGGITFTNDGGASISTRNYNFHTSQYYTVSVAPRDMFIGHSTSISGRDRSNNTGRNKTITGQTDVFVGGLQDNGNMFQVDNGDRSSSAIDVSGGDGAASMFSQDINNKYFVQNYVYNRSIEVWNLNTSPATNFQINSENESNGDFINVQALDSKYGVIYSNYESGGQNQVAAFVEWDDFKAADQNTNASKVILRNGALSSNVSAMTVHNNSDSSSSTLYIGTEGGQLLKVENANSYTSTTTGGVTTLTSDATWTRLTGSEFLGSISDIEFGKSDQEIFVTFHNYGVKNIFYSADGGANWSSKDGDLPNLPVRAILQNPLIEDEIIIGTELGVWYTKDFSSENPSWSRANNGMSDVRVTDLDLRLGDDNKVFAATYGLGIFSGNFAVNEPIINIDTDTKLITVDQGQSASFNINYKVYGGYDEDTTFSLEGLPENTTVDYDPSQSLRVNSNGSVEVTLNINEDALAKSYQVVVKATSNSQERETGFELQILSDDIDNDGVLNVDDNCPETANPNQEDSDDDGIGDVCDQTPFGQNAFSLQSTDETCRSSNNGELNLSVSVEGFDFKVTVNGGPNGFSHTPEIISGSSWSLKDLEASSYTVCLTTDSLNTFEQCFNVIINQPRDLSVLASIARDNNSIDFQLNGSDKYYISINGNRIITEESDYKLNLNKGLNVIRITGDKECQGVYEETIFNSEEILLSPNPAINSTSLWVGGNDKNVNLSMFDNSGRLIWTKTKELSSGRDINIETTNLKAGMYYIKVESETVRKTAKLVKK